MRDSKQKHSISGVQSFSWYFFEARLSAFISQSWRT
jgi:hypothetical protein